MLNSSYWTIVHTFRILSFIKLSKTPSRTQTTIATVSESPKVIRKSEQQLRLEQPIIYFYCRVQKSEWILCEINTVLRKHLPQAKRIYSTEFKLFSRSWNDHDQTTTTSQDSLVKRENVSKTCYETDDWIMEWKMQTTGHPVSSEIYWNYEIPDHAWRVMNLAHVIVQLWLNSSACRMKMSLNWL